MGQKCKSDTQRQDQVRTQRDSESGAGFNKYNEETIEMVWACDEKI